MTWGLFANCWIAVGLFVLLGLWVNIIAMTFERLFLFLSRILLANVLIARGNTESDGRVILISDGGT